jgi:hypothetical protein
MADPIPGTFHNEEDLPTDDKQDIINKIRKMGNKEILPVESKDEMADLNAFQNEFKPKSDLVYYPCCGSDVSPAKVFDGRVIFLDNDQKNIDALNKAGYEAVCADANNYEPGNVDILVVYNPQMRPEPFLKYVSENGYMVCNNWHGTADFMSRRDEFEFMGAVSQDGKVDRENLNDYWQKVETDEELFEADPSIEQQIQDIVTRLTGQSENILQNYRSILAENPTGMVPNGESPIILWGIPVKKQSGTYIFRRKINEELNN